MIDKIKKYLQENLLLKINTQDSAGYDAIQVAAAILFVEVMHADHVVDERERILIQKILKTTFGLTDHQSTELLETAEKLTENPVSLQEYTSVLNNNITHQVKLELVENIWRIMLADDAISKFEEHLVRRISELLYLRQSEFIRMKLKVIDA